MLHLDSGDPFEFATVDLNPLIHNTVAKLSQFIARKRLTVSYSLDPSLPMIRADAEQLAQAILKIVENAAQYSAEGETITVRTYLQEANAILEIEDSGVGIASADMPHIFERFYRADKARSIRTGGSGLGLPIAKRILEAHQGSIEVQSVFGQGTLFRILLWIS
jgi:two-component system phosphate regulon sensor histidine kinase PhoR